jgi:hypothetical protein
MMAFDIAFPALAVSLSEIKPAGFARQSPMFPHGLRFLARDQSPVSLAPPMEAEQDATFLESFSVVKDVSCL